MAEPLGAVGAVGVGLLVGVVALNCSVTKARTAAGSTCTARPSTGVSRSGLPVGMVRKLRSAPAMRLAWVAACWRSQPLSITTCRVTTPSELRERGRVGERALALQPLREARDERLLAGDPVEVAAVEAVALAHEGERHLAAHRLVARGQVEAGVGVAHRACSGTPAPRRARR